MARFPMANGQEAPQDLSVLFWAPEYYKNYTALLARLGVPIIECEMPTAIVTNRFDAAGEIYTSRGSKLHAGPRRSRSGSATTWRSTTGCCARCGASRRSSPTATPRRPSTSVQRLQRPVRLILLERRSNPSPWQEPHAALADQPAQLRLDGNEPVSRAPDPERQPLPSSRAPLPPPAPLPGLRAVQMPCTAAATSTRRRRTSRPWFMGDYRSSSAMLTLIDGGHSCAAWARSRRRARIRTSRQPVHLSWGGSLRRDFEVGCRHTREETKRRSSCYVYAAGTRREPLCGSTWVVCTYYRGSLMTTLLSLSV